MPPIFTMARSLSPMCFLLLLAFYIQPALSATNKCLTRFQTDRAHFAPCLNTTCFLFLNQIPWVILDPIMSKEEHQALFPCKNRRRLFPQLSGVSFEIHQEINFEALCVWGGKDCTFNEMTRFVSDLANDTDTNKYMFGVQGMITHLPARITPTLLPSVTIYQDMFILLKSIRRNTQSTAGVIVEVFRAFDLSTWGAIVAVILFLILLSCLMSYVHTGSVSANTVFNNLCGKVEEETDRTEGHNKLLRHTAVSLLGCACSIVFILVILFYEIGVVNFIFNEGADTLSKPLNKFSDKELELFGELAGSAPERMLEGSVGRKFGENSVPWKQCSKWDECFSKIFDPEDTMTYMVVGVTEARFRIKNAFACGKATILDTWSNPELTFQGNQGIPHGWYVSTAIPDEDVQLLNRELLEIKLNGNMHDILERAVGKDGGRCAQRKLSIAAQVLMLPFFFLAGPLIFVALVLLLRLSIIRKKFGEQELRKSQSSKSMSSYVRYWSRRH